MSEVYYIIGSDYCEGVHVPDIVSLLLPPPFPLARSCSMPLLRSIFEKTLAPEMRFNSSKMRGESIAILDRDLAELAIVHTELESPIL